jgi:Uma2 family endonuclease
MSGATVAHKRIAGGLYSRLLAAAADACQVFISDVKLRADSPPAYYYPDVMVVCDPADDEVCRVAIRTAVLAWTLAVMPPGPWREEL